MLPGFLDDDLGDTLDEIGGSALTTEAIPAALLDAATAPVPVTDAFQPRHGLDPRLIAGLHPACRATMGACIGARHGKGAWTSWGETQQPPGIPRDALAQTRGIDAVLATAGRIAGKRVRPVGRVRRRMSWRRATSPCTSRCLIDRSGSMSGLRGLRDAVPTAKSCHKGPALPPAT